MIDVLPAGVPVPEGSVHCEGQLQDVLYHGASSRCHVRIDPMTTLAVARSGDCAVSFDAIHGWRRVRLAWRPEHAVPLQG